MIAPAWVATQMAILEMGRGSEMCAEASKHDDQRTLGILNWRDWVKKKSKTHAQHRCPTCGFWVMWKRKPTRKGAMP